MPSSSSARQTARSRSLPASNLETPLPDVLDFMQLLWAVVHGLERSSKAMAAELGVTGPQRLVLRVVGLFPGLSAGDLAAVLHVHPSTLTGVLQRLVAQRMLVRVADPVDRRRAVLRLAARGDRINATRSGTVESAVAAALAGCPAADRLAARRVLERLAQRLGSHASALAVRAQARHARGGGRRSPVPASRSRRPQS